MRWGADCDWARQRLHSVSSRRYPSRCSHTGATHPSSAGVMASTVRPNCCQYQAVEPRANRVAPMGRALFFSADAAPSAEALDVEAARYTVNSSAKMPIGGTPRPGDTTSTQMDCWSSRELSAGRGWAVFVPKRFCSRHCGSRRRRCGPIGELSEPTWCVASRPRARKGAGRWGLAVVIAVVQLQSIWKCGDGLGTR
jgi:hypothetical protein